MSFSVNQLIDADLRTFHTLMPQQSALLHGSRIRFLQTFAIRFAMVDHLVTMISLLVQAAVAPSSITLTGADWLEQLITGPLGTSLAVVAVAWFGFSLLSGRVSIRHGGVLFVGCFILFGAPAIARSLLLLAQGLGRGMVTVQPQLIEVTPLPAAPSPPAYDPYAGASVSDDGN